MYKLEGKSSHDPNQARISRAPRSLGHGGGLMGVNPSVGQGKTSDLNQNHHEPKQGDEPCDAFLEGKNILLQLQNTHVGDVDGHHLGHRGLYPSGCSGRWHATLECHLDIASSSNEFPKSMVIFALNSRRGSHALMMAFPSGSQ